MARGAQGLSGKNSKLDWFKSVIDGTLRTDLDVPGEQRHTKIRVFHRAHRYGRDRKPLIRIEAGSESAQA